MRWTRWTEFKKRRKNRYDKKSTAAPVNTTPPSITDGGNGLFLANKGVWDNYPTEYVITWRVNGSLVEYGESYQKPDDVLANTISLTVEASNDNGSNSVTVP